MNKALLSIFFLMLLVNTVISACGIDENVRINTPLPNAFTHMISYCIVNDTERLDQEQNRTTSDVDGPYRVSQWALAQSFVPKLPYISRVELSLFSEGSPIDLMISIRDDLDGDDLTSVTIDGFHYNNVSWVSFDFADISVTPGQTYYILWVPTIYNPQLGKYHWCYGNDNPYKRGNSWAHIEGEEWKNIEEIYDPFFNRIDFCFKTYGYSNSPTTPYIQGPSSGKQRVDYEYSLVSTDPDGDNVFYHIDWGDGSIDTWIGPFGSGAPAIIQHSWSKEGTYTISVQAKDSYDFESDCATLEVSMPKMHTYNPIMQPILKLLERFLLLQPILK